MHLETVKNLEKALFTTTKADAVVHSCVVAFDKKRAVSFRHGPHSKFKKKEKVDLYNVFDPEIQLEAVVRSISEVYDVIVFELLSGEFSNYPYASDVMYRGQDYKQLGINPLRDPIWKAGIISESHVGFFIGSSHGTSGDSGSGIFDLSGRFLGISIAKKNLIFADRGNVPIGEAADHHPDTTIIDRNAIFAISDIVGPDPFEPPEKKHMDDMS